MKDIAIALGVSVATVSRALQNSNKISKEKRELIVNYARLHNFSPNIIAENLRRSRTSSTKIIGVIIPQFTHFYFSSVLSGIEEQAALKGYSIMVAQSNESYKREVSICNSFFKNKVCGIIVSQAKGTKEYSHFQNLINYELPLVFYDRICTEVNADRVVVDDYKGAFNAVQYLINTGCRRIAYYGASMNLEIFKNRFNGYKDALQQNGILINPQYIINCDTRDEAEKITPELLQMPNRPDAFFAINDDIAIGILYTAKRMGFNVPRDVSVCGFTNGHRATACDPMLTTVEQRGAEVGREAVELLINKVERIVPFTKPQRRIVKTRLVIRGTTNLLNNDNNYQNK